MVMQTALEIAKGVVRYGEKRLNMLGGRHECYICKQRFNHFYPYKGGEASRPPFVRELEVIGSDIDHFSCPFCRSHDRERHLFMFFDRLGLWDALRSSTVLHVAPERKLAQAIGRLEPTIFVQADLQPTSKEVRRVDIVSIEFPDDHFDFIICNHVLEHVVEDEKAMSELFRVLKRGGHAVLQTPFTKVLSRSFEDSSIATDELRKRYYGEASHVRVYGRDLFTKLERVGFCLKLKRHGDYFSQEESVRFGVNPREDLILVSKQVDIVQSKLTDTAAR
jgi:predicted SAM-dependent methyltransferase